MANVRRFFRYDVEVPVYFELVDSEGICLHATKEQLLSDDEQSDLGEINAELNELLEFNVRTDAKGFEVFYQLNQRIRFFSWLIEKLMEGEDPKESHDYNFRIREDQKNANPQLNSSKIKVLIEGMNSRLGLHILELNESLQNSLDNKVFLFPRPVNPLFESTAYVTNLEQLARSGIVPAKILNLLIQKLNIWEKIFTRLKISNRVISDPGTWSVKKINLSAGGFSVLSQQNFTQFDHMNVFIQLGEDILISRAKVLFCRPLKDQNLNKVAIEFEFLSMENAEKITLFVQRREIQDAIGMKPI